MSALNDILQMMVHLVSYFVTVGKKREMEDENIDPESLEIHSQDS